MELQESTRIFPSLAFLLPSAVILWVIYRRIKTRVYKLPPGPTIEIPLLGYLPFASRDPHIKFYELSKTYGPVMSVSLGLYTGIVVSDYEHAKELLCHPACLGRPDVFFNFLPYKAGFAGMNGDVWQEQRRFCIHTMRDLGIGKGPWERIIQDDVTEFIEYLVERKGKPVDISGPLERAAISSNTAVLVGRRFPKKETNPDVKVMEKAHHVIIDHGKLSNPAAVVPWLLKCMIKFNIARYGDKIKDLENFCDILRREIAKHQRCEDDFDSSDFIGRYLDVLNKEDATDVNKYYSVDNLMGHLVALFVGGGDTVVASLRWLLLLMAEHPQVQQNVQREIDDIFGMDGQISWDDRKILPYTMATIVESQRWSTLVPFYPPRSVTEAFKFRGYNIPKGALIIGNNWAIQHDPKHWDNPYKFMPERILETAEKSGKDPSKLDGYGAFSYGKRKCPGETFAMMTVFLYFTDIIQKFRVQMPPGRRANFNAHYTAIMQPCSQELCFFER